MNKNLQLQRKEKEKEREKERVFGANIYIKREKEREV